MQTATVKATRVARQENTPMATPDLAEDLRRARWLANWLDAKFSILGYRFGIEGIIGLIPVVGDTLGAVAGAYPIYVAHRHKLGRQVELRMASNLAIEWLLGITPVIGDVADVWYKANLRNLQLLEKAAMKQQRSIADQYH